MSCLQTLYTIRSSRMNLEPSTESSVNGLRELRHFLLLAALAADTKAQNYSIIFIQVCSLRGNIEEKGIQRKTILCNKPKK